MSNIEIIYDALNNKKTVFLYDDYEQVVIKLIPVEDGNTKAFAKRKGRKEYSLEANTKVVYNAELGGQIVDQEFYDSF
ncbi:MAG: hypothetical protein K0M63_05835 [Weeksellaceae bacterium]|nr:hypothetical protein [Weeksellaceae bacterium]